jgi:hypothetical protein
MPPDRNHALFTGLLSNGCPLNKERNDAADAFGHNPKGTGLSGRMAALRRLAVE